MLKIDAKQTEDPATEHRTKASLGGEPQDIYTECMADLWPTTITDTLLLLFSMQRTKNPAQQIQRQRRK